MALSCRARVFVTTLVPLSLAIQSGLALGSEIGLACTMHLITATGDQQDIVSVLIDPEKQVIVEVAGDDSWFTDQFSDTTIAGHWIFAAGNYRLSLDRFTGAIQMLEYVDGSGYIENGTCVPTGRLF